MGFGSGLKQAVDYLADTPSSQYTLADLVGKKGLCFKFGRAARVAERLTTVSGLAMSAILLVGGAVGVAVAPEAAAVGIAGGLLFAGVSKLSGLFNGAVVHVLAKTTQALVNGSTQSSAADKPKAPSA